MEVADEAVAEGAQTLVVEVARSSPPLVEVAAAGTGCSEHSAQRSAASESRRLRTKRAFTVRLRPDATVSGEVAA